MQNVKKMDLITPFLGYRLDCYRHALLPAVRYFKRDFRPFFFLNHGNFAFNGKLSFEEMQFCEYRDILMNIGINREYRVVSDNTLILQICDKIEKDKIVIVFIDTYYYSKFPSSYLKFHSRHGIPVFGYNLIEKTFDVIDSNYIESFDRVKTTITFDELLYAHSNMVNYYDMHDYIEIIVDGDVKNSSFFYDYIERYQNFYVEKKDIFEKSLADFKSFVNFYHDGLCNDDAIKSMVGSIYNVFNRVINLRHLEYTAFKKCFKDVNATLNCLEELVSLYNYVRAIAYKYLYSEEYRKESFERCGYAIEKIFKLEKHYYEIMCINNLNKHIVKLEV